MRIFKHIFITWYCFFFVSIAIYGIGCDGHDSQVVGNPTPEQFEKIEIGMTESEIIALIGEPNSSIIIDPIPSGELYLLYYHKPNPKTVLVFKDENLNAVYVEENLIRGEALSEKLFDHYFDRKTEL